MYFDWLYLILVIPAMIFAIAMQALVSNRFTKYGATMTKKGINGYQAARMLLDANGLYDVPIDEISGDL
ncbi:MAG: zinc metallopeptidase, partial [Lachnospiraceae bacterium]|nr:zinc metallopeptidase [Lachnospiraceae bacterium]